MEATAHHLTDKDQSIIKKTDEILQYIINNCSLAYKCQFKMTEMNGVYYQTSYQCSDPISPDSGITTTYFQTTETCKKHFYFLIYNISNIIKLK